MAVVVNQTQFPYRIQIPTRWNDNDMLGHVNNVVYYSYFEAVVVRFLMEQGGLDWLADPIIPYAAESLCQFKRPISFPTNIEAGLGVSKLGNTSVTYEMALFAEDEIEMAARGHWVHVFVDRDSERPVPVPNKLRALFEKNLLAS